MKWYTSKSLYFMLTIFFFFFFILSTSIITLLCFIVFLPLKNMFCYWYCHCYCSCCWYCCSCYIKLLIHLFTFQKIEYWRMLKYIRRWGEHIKIMQYFINEWLFTFKNDIHCELCDYSPCNSIRDPSYVLYSSIIAQRISYYYTMLTRQMRALYTNFSTFYILLFYYLL